jgi:EAL domain-containing protein (putative c-di-GMP-specific phosphodiesterase class I)
VIKVATGALFGQRAKLFVRTEDGHPAPPESLYVQAWDADDVVFLDRFLRTFHALNHLHQGHDGRELLVLDVHLRHVAALPEHHGEVFETLLHRFGLRTDQVVLRLDARALHTDAHVQEAARSFTGYGYRLLAAGPDLDHTDWDLLGALGVRWVAPQVQDLEVRYDRGERWRAQTATGGRIGLWLAGIDDPEALARAGALGADLIEGNQSSRAARQAPPRYPLSPADVAV